MRRKPIDFARRACCPWGLMSRVPLAPLARDTYHQSACCTRPRHEVDNGRSIDARHLRHRRGLGRVERCGGCGGVRRSRGARRKGEDGRRVPPYRLRPVEITHRRRQARPCDRRGEGVRPFGARFRGRFCRRAQARSRRHCSDRAQRFEGTLHRAWRAPHRGRRALSGWRHGRGRR